MRPVWSGAVAFGLVNIPVKLYSAIQRQPIKFRLLHRKHLSPIKYERTCAECKKPVPWEDVTKGLEIRRGQYIVLEPDEIAGFKPGKTNTIEIREFVSSEIPDILISAHYYVAPNGSERPFALLREALKSAKKTAIGTFVMREKEYVCAIRPFEEGILLSTLHYAYEVRDMGAIEELKELPSVKKQELELAKQLIDNLTSKQLVIKEYKDTFAEELKKLVKRKAKGETITVVSPEAKQAPTEDLVAALRESLKA